MEMSVVVRILAGVMALVVVGVLVYRRKKAA
jgi:LPXTG-motif cell wall-anchored protein